MAVHARRMRLAVLLVLVVACTWYAQLAVGEDQKPAAQVHTVLISGFKYQPGVLAVNIGDTVEWKNADIVPHTVTAVEKSFNSGSIAPGATWTLVANKTGTFNYICTLHPNMKARLVVH
jgi:plastocyanin